MSASTAICEACSTFFTPTSHSAGRYCSRKCIHSATPEQRFWKYVRKSDSCWIWIGDKSGTKSVYGRIKVKGRFIRAHRFSWELVNGQIPAGLLACHTCDNPMCVRPDHIYLGTQSDNIQEAFAKGRKHPPDNNGENGKMNKLVNAQVLEIRRLAAEGAKPKILANEFRVSRRCIYGILARQRWKHI